MTGRSSFANGSCGRASSVTKRSRGAFLPETPTGAFPAETLTDAQKSRAIHDALRARHPAADGWVFAEELRLTTGWQAFRTVEEAERFRGLGVNNESRMDAFAVHTWQSKNLLRVGYEVKVSRSDLRRDLAKPWKHDGALAFTNKFYFVLHDSINLKGLMIPKHFGVMVFTDGKGFTTVRSTKFRDVPEPPLGLWLMMLRNLQAAAR